jgi:hypothetical protein
MSVSFPSPPPRGLLSVCQPALAKRSIPLGRYSCATRVPRTHAAGCSRLKL